MLPSDRRGSPTIRLLPTTVKASCAGGRRPLPWPLAPHRNQRSQDRLRLLEAHVDLSTQPSVPSESRSRVALRRLIPEQQAELQGFSRISPS
jgi:hypothetical protein